MASHLSWFVNLLFLLMILARAPTIDTRPARAAPTAELIAGNEFLKLLFERGDTQRELHSGESDENERVVRAMAVRVGSDSNNSGGKPSRGTVRERRVTRANNNEPTADSSAQLTGLGSRGAAARSHNYKSRNVQNDAASTATTTTTTSSSKTTTEESKQVVKLVTTGSKIIFLEEYDDNDAVVDTVVRDIDLQKERVSTPGKQVKKETATQQVQMQHKSNPSDEVKVVAVSVSSSSKRGGFSRANNHYSTADTVLPKQANKLSEMRASLHHTDIMRQQYKQTLPDSGDDSPSDGSATSLKLTLTTTPPTAPLIASATSTMDDFVNRSHKSEFSIEEAEPLTMSPQKQRASAHVARANSPRTLHTPHAVSGRAVKMPASLSDVVDSENSASTNIQNVLAAPLVQSASTRTATATPPAAYHSSRGSGNNNRNSTSSHINHSSATAAHSHAGSHISADVDMADTVMLDTSAPAASGDTAVDVEDKLLPFQTVIYHNSKEGHGPQSRSISYSSLSQNVDDLHAWRHSGILAEAQRNVSDSLKQLPQLTHNSEPAKFYSVPSKMYSEPSKFYSEPAKVYSEPAKVYGEPEKFYSEPAKVYGQPSKFYSEPSKVYSQPSKVYGEPAKTYWSPNMASVSEATTSTTATSSTSPTPTTTVRPGRYMPSRRPAIVSRIAFGEAQISTAAPLAIDEHAPATMAVPSNHQQQQPHHTHHQSHTRFHAHASHGSHSHSPSQSNYAATAAAQPAQSHSQSQSHPAPAQPRRVLSNLDKLPYDLLNAPVQSSQHLLDPNFSHSPPAAVTYSSPRQRQCLESAFSASLSQSTLQQQQLQQRQHSSLSDQHSNQNAKGLPNRDLVKCVSKYNQPLPTATGATESNHSGDDGDDDVDLYTPTPEQNYEIEESVSVMTNGRAHGVQGNSAATTTAQPHTMRTTKFASRGGIQYQQQHHYHGNANANANMDNNYDDNGGDPGGLDGGGADDGIDADGSKTGNDDEDAKVAYVVEGRNYRKYRVEEKTDDGFIVGEYGVVDHNDGNLRGVRYTADSTINRSLIQKALLTFLKLK